MVARTPIRANTISDIAITRHEKPFAMRIAWTDADGARRAATRYGPRAQQLNVDLQATAVMGDVAQHCFLVGLIRGLIDLGGLDEGMRQPSW